MNEHEPPRSLLRSLGTGDAVVVGLGSMLGAGVFVAVGPAAAAAGSALLVSLVLAGAIAYLNATSSARLAARYPESGGTYVYARERLGTVWGFLAGWAFVAGKLASCTTIALGFGAYVAPSLARPLAVGAVVVATAINYRGATKTVRLTRVLVVVVLACLAGIVAAMLAGGDPQLERVTEGLLSATPAGILRGAGLLFFAFAGYARIATLGEEVRDPARSIRRAIPLALAIALVVYLVTEASVLLVLGPGVVASSATPLADATAAGRLSELAPLARIGAGVASLGVLVSLLAGVARTVFAMARNRELPARLATVHPRFRVPNIAQVAVGGVVAVLAALADLREALGFSSFAVLGYYALTNASAWTLRAGEYRGSRVLAALGLAGCVVLALTLPVASVLAGSAVLGAGLVIYLMVKRSPA